jgi:ABC-type cobalamin/Fe3+-siderophores transport system ATPase subunit
MESIIKKVSIYNLWDYKNIICELYEDVNIVIGSNGTSKTTFLRIVEAILNVDLQSIENLSLNKVEIILKSGDITHTVSYIRIFSEDGSFSSQYKIDDEEPIEILSFDYYRPRYSPRKNYFYLKDKMEQLVNVSWLSINRIDESNDRNVGEKDVDRKLSQLMSLIVSYKLELETQINNRTKKFNEDFASLLLYNQDIDTMPDSRLFKSICSTSNEDLTSELHQVFSFFGDAREHTDQILLHVEKIRRLTNLLKEDEPTDVNADDVLAFSLLNRTMKMLELSHSYQNERNEIMEPVNKYIDILGKFMRDKSFKFNAKGEMNIFLKNSNKEKEDKRINIKSLSSGEKQLLILFTETLLQFQKPYVFIADEPELSLHIEWQRNLIKSIRLLNPNAQIIFATHAPEIAANAGRRFINMERFTIYESDEEV